MKSKRVTEITQALNNLDKKDIYSMMLFILYKMKDEPEYLALSEISYLLNGEELVKFLSYYGGMTVKIPTLQDMRLVLQGLTLYQFVNLEEGTFEEGLRNLVSDEFSKDDLKKVYSDILKVVENYEFCRDE